MHVTNTGTKHTSDIFWLVLITMVIIVIGPIGLRNTFFNLGHTVVPSGETDVPIPVLSVHHIAADRQSAVVIFRDRASSPR